MATALTAKTRLFQYLEDYLARVLRGGDTPLRVWLDTEGVFLEAARRLRAEGFFAEVLIHDGSYIETVMALEGKVDGLDPEPLILYLSGHNTETIKTTPLYEIYCAGRNLPSKGFHSLVKEAAAGVVDPEKLQQEVPQLRTFQEAEAWLEAAKSGSSRELQMRPDDFVYKLLSAPEKLFGRPLTEADEEKLLSFWTLNAGLLQTFREQLPRDTFAHAVIGWLLLMEYAFDLKRTPTGKLKVLRDLSAFREVCDQCLSRVRDSFPERYCEIALRLEVWQPLAEDLASGSPEELGRIDTFSAEDQRLLGAALESLRAGDWNKAGSWAKQRLKGQSVWLKREPEREHLWQFVAVGAELGRRCQSTPTELSGCQDHYEILEHYRTTLQQVDRTHRELEQLYDGLQIHYSEKLGSTVESLRAVYDDWFDDLGRSFNAFCESKGFLPPADLQQRNLYEDVVHPLVQQPDKCAFFMVDALRFEMAIELEERLAGPGLTSLLQARLAELPTDTKIGMNALSPVSVDGKLTPRPDLEGFVRDDFAVGSTRQRLRAMGNRSLTATGSQKKEPTAFKLKEVVTASAVTLAEKVKKAKMIVVTSRELDIAGEKDLGYSTFADTLGRIASAVRALNNAGVKRFILAADHGFGLTSPNRPQICYYNGIATRRYVLAPSGAGPVQDVLVLPLRALSYEGTTDVLVLPRDGRTFACKGELAKTFYHGGNSLQERAIPVLSLDFTDRGAAPAERAAYRIHTTVEDQMPTLLRLRLTVEEGEQERQLLLTEASETTIRLAFEGQGEGHVTLGGSSHGTVENGQLIVAAGAPVESVFLQLKGRVEAIKIYHPDGEYLVTPATISLDQEPRKVTGDWETAVSDPLALKILRHLNKHQSITEAEIIDLTNNTRAARRFARLLPTLQAQLPFKVRVDTGQGNTYIKE